MRRRPIILCILAAALLGGASLAFADPPATTVGVKALGESPDAQVGATLAVNPVVSANAPVVALGTDWRGGVRQPQTGVASGTVQGTSGTTVWSDRGLLPNTTSSPPSVSGGSPDVVWGPGNKVYAVELGRDSTDQQNQCSTNAGLFLDVSSNGGANWAPPVELDSDNANLTISDPSIAYSAVTSRIYIAYTVTDCNGTTSQIHLISTTNDVTGNGPQTGVSSAIGATQMFMHPSIAALPNGSVAVAYYDGAPDTGPAVLVTTCAPTDPATIGSPPACAASPVVVDASAPAPNPINGLAMDVRPSIAADPASSRLVVAWHKAMPLGGSDVFSSTSLDGGATFGAPVPVGNVAAGDQFDPNLAIAADGRVDIAYFDSEFTSGNGYEVAVSASNRPSPGFPTETWSSPVSLESSRIVPTAPYVPGQPDIGSRVGIAEIPRSGSNRAWTIVGWPDTDNVTASNPLNEDIYSNVLLHQSTAPVTTPFPNPVPVSKNADTAVAFGSRVTDADADPPTYTIDTNGGIGSATINDKNVPTLTYHATTVVGLDTVVVGVDDGVHHSTLTIRLSVQNDPPTISCPTLETPYETPIVLAATTCGFDKNKDLVTLSAMGPVDGTLTGSGPTLTFVPAASFSGNAQVTLTANDGELSSLPTAVTIKVDPPPPVIVTIAGVQPRAARTDRAIEFHATPNQVGVDPSKIVWDFGDGSTYEDHGPSVAHLYTQVGSYTVSASIGDGPVAHVLVLVQKPPLVVRSTSLLRRRMVKLQLQIANPGKLVVGLVGIHGSHKLKVKMKRGTHTVRMLLPATARTNGTILVSLALSLPNGGTEHLRRAVMLPRR